MKIHKAKELLPYTVVTNGTIKGTLIKFTEDHYGFFGWLIDWETFGVKFTRLEDMQCIEVF